MLPHMKDSLLVTEDVASLVFKFSPESIYFTELLSELLLTIYFMCHHLITEVQTIHQSTVHEISSITNI